MIDNFYVTSCLIYSLLDLIFDVELTKKNTTTLSKTFLF